ncbi:hypothetical protein HDU67_003373, partial [Dinochytrium kinnereticum]
SCTSFGFCSWTLPLGSRPKEPLLARFSVASYVDVADFRKAVYRKNSSILTGINSSQLIVYKNKAAFDKRNAAIDDEKEEPLKSTRLMDGLEKQERKPSLSSSRRQSSHTKSNLHPSHSANSPSTALATSLK